MEPVRHAGRLPSDQELEEGQLVMKVSQGQTTKIYNRNYVPGDGPEEAKTRKTTVVSVLSRRPRPGYKGPRGGRLQTSPLSS